VNQEWVIDVLLDDCRAVSLPIAGCSSQSFDLVKLRGHIDATPSIGIFTWLDDPCITWHLIFLPNGFDLLIIFILRIRFVTIFILDPLSFWLGFSFCCPFLVVVLKLQFKLSLDFYYPIPGGIVVLLELFEFCVIGI
jgi:hypothetical protein